MAPATLVRQVQRRMPTVSYSTLIEFSEVVYSVAQDRGNNTHGAHKDFLRVIDRAVRNGEEWACEAIGYARTTRTSRR